jgi:hypothetical protein
LSKMDKSYITQIGVVGFAIMGLFYNEKYNCTQMLSFNEEFPFHVILEIFGLAAFYLVSRFFYDLWSFMLYRIWAYINTRLLRSLNSNQYSFSRIIIFRYFLHIPISQVMKSSRV